MNGNVTPELAAQAQARREATANLGSLKSLLLALAKDLPPDCGSRPVQEALRYLQDKDASRLAGVVEHLRQELRGVCDLNNDEAEQWKKRGDKARDMAKLEECVLMYTRGMMYASEDETLTQLIYNRCNVFLEQSRFLEALADAHVVFTSVPNDWNALKCRGVCLQRLGFEDEGKRDIDAAANANGETVNAEEVISRILHEKNGKTYTGGVPSLGKVDSPFLEDILFRDGTKGVVAKSHLEPGEVITETPIAYALYDDHWCIRCCQCLRVTRALYPGTAYRVRGKLARGLFCSEVCADQSWERYGQYETANPFFHVCPVDVLIASRMLRFGRATSKFRSPCGSFTGELCPAAVIGGYETAVSLCALLLGAVSVEDVDRLRFAQRQVLQSGFEIRFFTGSQITINLEMREALIDESRPVAVGKAVYMAAAQLGHSCVPNCHVSFVENPLDCSLKLTIRAIKPISLGEELTIAYHNITTYMAVSALTRRRALFERCGVLCNCTACINNKEERVTMEKKDYYVQASDLYQKGCRLIREGQCDVAVTVLSQSYKIAMEHLCPPPQPPQSMIPKTHMALAKGFNRLKDNQKCVKHLVAKAELERALYGEHHVELIDDCIRLAFFAPTEEERRGFAEQVKERLFRFYAPSKAINTQIQRLESFVARENF